MYIPCVRMYELAIMGNKQSTTTDIETHDQPSSVAIIKNNGSSHNAPSNGTSSMRSAASISNNEDDDPAKTRSIHSSAPDKSSRSSLSAPAKAKVQIKKIASTPSLHKNMMRHVKNRDPFSIYEATEVLGVGSMGSVSKVRKRSDKTGGSARPHNVSKSTTCWDCNPVTGTCASLPLIGGLFRECFGGRRYRQARSRGEDNGSSPGSSAHNNGSTRSATSSGDSEGGGSSSADIFSSFRRNLVSSLRRNTFSSWRRREDLLRVPGNTDRTGKKDGMSRSLHIRNDEPYEIKLALKSIHLNRVTDATFVRELRNEIELLRSLDHPHIVRPIEVFEYRKNIYFTMEALSGGDLYTRDPYSEGDAARIITAILSAIAYMHSKNISHRDLKYENVMFVNKSPDAIVKLIDFGLSKKFSKDYLRDGVGTIYTMSPEVIRGAYTSKADCWSIGVLLYMLLSSQLPFYGKKRRQVVENIIKAKYDYSGRRWKKVSPEARSFVDSLLQIDPEKRPSAEEALHCEWLENKAKLRASLHYDKKTEDEAMDQVQATIQNFADYSKLKKLALMVIAHRSTADEIGFLRRAFKKYDLQKTGVVTMDEFKECLGPYGYSNDELEEMFEGCDIDGTGKIRYTEFLAATIEAHGAINEEKIAEAFDRLDADDSGFISTKNLREILGKDIPMADIDAIIDEADLTGDGRISYEEFLFLFDIRQEERRVVALKDVTARRLRNSMLSLSGADTDTSMPTSMDLSERSCYDDPEEEGIQF